MRDFRESAGRRIPRPRTLQRVRGAAILAAGSALAVWTPEPPVWHQPWARVQFRATGRRDAMPKQVRISPDGRLAVIPCMSSNTVAVYAAPEVRWLASIRVPAKMPVECVFSDDSKTVYVQCLQPGILVKIDLARMAVVAKSKPHGLWPKVVEFTPDRSELWITAWLGNTVDVLDAATLRLTRKIKVARTPRGLGFMRTEPRAYIANFGEYDQELGGVTEIDTRTYAIIRTFMTLKGAPRHITISPDDRRVYVSNMGQDRIHVIDTRSDTVVAHIPTGHCPKTTDLTSDGRYLYVANFNDTNRNGSVGVWDCVNDRPAGSWAEGHGTTGLDVSPDDRFVWAVNIGDNTLSVHRIIPE